MRPRGFFRILAVLALLPGCASSLLSSADSTTSSNTLGRRIPLGQNVSGVNRNEAAGTSAVETSPEQVDAEAEQSEQRTPDSEPPRIYRTLTRLSVGRYVVAASSLFGECVRIYAPAPLSSLCTRLCIVFGSAKRTTRMLDGKRNPPPGLSYERFMSRDHRSEDEDALDGDELGGAFLTPPEKYGRASSAFLVRHALGHFEDVVGKVGTRGSPVARPLVGIETLGTTTSAGADSVATGRRRFGFRPLAAFGRRRLQVGDDLDLLSDVDEEEVNAVSSEAAEMTAHRGVLGFDGEGAEAASAETGGVGTRLNCGTKGIAQEAALEKRQTGNPTARTGHSERSFSSQPRTRPSRSLISGVDDTVVALMRKLQASERRIKNESVPRNSFTEAAREGE